MSTIAFIISILIIATVAASIVIYNRRKTDRILDSIEKMLDLAIKNEFSENSFDESRLSSLETLFSQYLSKSLISANRVEIEKDKIKTLISDISHQTKTPIANLVLYSELLEEEELTPSAKEKVEEIKVQAEKLRFLISALVKLSRLENGILTLHPKLNSISPLIKEVEAQYKPKAEEKGLALNCIDADIEALFDYKWTYEALSNIVDNAIKYTEKGSVTIFVKAYEQFVSIQVSDTGPGIRESESNKIFSRFYRSESVREKEGVGIGLYLAREIIQGENGYIKLTSTLSKGSTFAIFLLKK